MSQSLSFSDPCIWFIGGNVNNIRLIDVRKVSEIFAFPYIEANIGDVIYAGSIYYICKLDKKWSPMRKPKKELKAAVLLLKG